MIHDDSEEPSNRDTGGLDILALKDESLDASDKRPGQVGLTRQQSVYSRQLILSAVSPTG